MASLYNWSVQSDNLGCLVNQPQFARLTQAAAKGSLYWHDNPFHQNPPWCVCSLQSERLSSPQTLALLSATTWEPHTLYAGCLCIARTLLWQASLLTFNEICWEGDVEGILNFSDHRNVELQYSPSTLFNKNYLMNILINKLQAIFKI